MLSVDDFVSKFENYNDDQLFEIYSELENYSAEAKEAFNKVITKKGGIDTLKDKIQRKRVLQAEAVRISNEVKKLSLAGNDIDFLKKIISSDVLPREAVHQTIENSFYETKADE